MSLEDIIKNLIKDKNWAKDLLILTNKNFQSLKSSLLKNSELPSNIIKELEDLFFLQIYLIVINNPENYLISTSKVIGSTSPLRSLTQKDQSAIITNTEIIQAACESLINSFALIPSFLVGHAQIAYDNYDKKLHELNGIIANQQGQIKVHEKGFEDKQEEAKKTINAMAQSYIETCRIYKTHKPRNYMLAIISGVDERTWKIQKHNEIFMKHLLGELKKIYGNAKKQRPTWKKAMDFVNTKIDFISTPDHFKLKYGLDEKSDSAKKTGSKTDKVKAEEIRQEQNDEDISKIHCMICGDPIGSGELCEGCLEEFPIKK